MGGSEFDDILVGDDQNNYLSGYAGDDALDGADGDDELSGGTGADLMVGGPDNDTYYVDQAGDVVTEWAGEGTDRVLAYLGAQATYTLPDYVEHLSLTGGASNGNGNALANILHGSAAANVLNGFGGQDYLYGHGGGDTFVWSSDSHTGVTQETADLLVDFSFADGDHIDLSGIDADVYTAGNQAFTFIGSNAFSGTPGEVNYYHAGGNTYIQMQCGTAVDVEGVIYMPGIVTPQASWFVL